MYTIYPVIHKQHYTAGVKGGNIIKDREKENFVEEVNMGVYLRQKIKTFNIS